MRWFKHMSQAWQDERLSALMDKFGLVGYGFWWRVAEIVAHGIDEKNITSVTFSAKKWGNMLGISPKKFQNLAEFCANLGIFLIKNDENKITIEIPNILKYCDEWTKRQIKNSGVTPELLRSSSLEVEEEEEDLNTPPYPPNDSDPEPDPPEQPAAPPPEAALSGLEKNTPQIYPPEFEAFWQHYPRKVGKGQALKAWNASRKRRPPGCELLTALEEQTRSYDWRKEGGRYVPNPATWLNGDGWLNELRQQEPPGSRSSPAKVLGDVPEELRGFSPAAQRQAMRTMASLEKLKQKQEATNG